MMSGLASLEEADAQNRLDVKTIGMSVKGKDIPLVTICDPNTSIESTKRLFVICRQHGNEPASTEAMLKLIRDLTLDKSEETADLLSKVSFFIVPMMNPDGADRNDRRNANGADLNRDWLMLSQPETICAQTAIDLTVPDVIIDQHELSPRNRESDFIEVVGLTSGALPEIATESKRMLDLVAGMLRTHYMTVETSQIEDQHPARLAHRYFPIYYNKTTILFETRQAGPRQYQLNYRINLHIAGTMTVAKYLAGREEELVQRIAEYDTRHKWIQLASRGKKPSKSIGKSASKRR